MEILLRKLISQVSSIVVLLAIALSVSTSSAAPRTIPARTVPTQLSLNDVQIIVAALNMASGTCAQDVNGCIIGLNKGAIVTKLQAAAAALATNKEGPRK